MAGDISFAEWDTSVRGWVNQVRYADSQGLRRHVRARLRPERPAASPRGAELNVLRDANRPPCGPTRR